MSDALSARVEWKRGDDPFLDGKYSRAHSWTFDGGAVVSASSSPHIVPLPFSVAAAVDPEEAFVASLASCHLLWFLSICAKRGFYVNGYTDSATGEMSVNERGKQVISVVRLHPCVDWVGEIPDDSIVVDLHRQAHEECFIANSVRTTVLIEPLFRMDRKVQ